MTEASATPARVNFPSDAHKLFTYGPTKCAVILRDMVQQYDSVHGTNFAAKSVGKILGRMDEVLFQVKSGYLALLERRKKGNLYQQQERGGFKEHYAWLTLENEWKYRIIDRLPNELADMLRAVAIEKINMAKAAVGAAPAKSGVNYTTHDLIEWSMSAPVQRARGKFVRKLKRYKPSY
jgi:hypothetical protein